MAVTYGFYDSLNHDRLYNAQQMSAIFDGIINDGVFMSVGNQFHTVAGTGMQVIVKSGRAWFDSTWTLNDAEYPLSIDAADVLLTRIDAVVLEVNSEVATRANTIKVVKGTPASTPAKPTLTNTATIHQHALAYVTVAKNTTAITNSMIEIVVGKTETPYVTAILQTTDITDLFKKWESDFQIWFETVKGTLDGDVALNLQNQIDHCVKKADKATSADIEAGTADKWVDSETLIKNYNVYPIGTDLLSTTDISKEIAKHGKWISGPSVTIPSFNYKELYNKINGSYSLIDNSQFVNIMYKVHYVDSVVDSNPHLSDYADQLSYLYMDENTNKQYGLYIYNENNDSYDSGDIYSFYIKEPSDTSFTYRTYVRSSSYPIFGMNDYVALVLEPPNIVAYEGLLLCRSGYGTAFGIRIVDVVEGSISSISANGSTNLWANSPIIKYNNKYFIITKDLSNQTNVYKIYVYDRTTHTYTTNTITVGDSSYSNVTNFVIHNNYLYAIACTDSSGDQYSAVAYPITFSNDNSVHIGTVKTIAIGQHESRWATIGYPFIYVLDDYVYMGNYNFLLKIQGTSLIDSKYNGSGQGAYWFKRVVSVDKKNGINYVITLDSAVTMFNYLYVYRIDDFENGKYTLLSTISRNSINFYNNVANITYFDASKGIIKITNGGRYTKPGPVSYMYKAHVDIAAAIYAPAIGGSIVHNIKIKEAR